MQTALLVVSFALVAGGFGSAVYTGSFNYDAGYLLWFILGIGAGAIGVLGFGLWLLVHFMLKV
jgi:hypothetical protein